jgi:hypothetical protein
MTEDTLIHAMSNRWNRFSLCHAAYDLKEGRNGMLFPEHRNKVTCPSCLLEIARRVDGTPLSHLQLTTRASNCFSDQSIYTIEYVESKSDRDLLTLQSLGKVSLREVREAIKKWRKSQTTNYGGCMSMSVLHPSTFDYVNPTEDQKKAMLVLREAAKTYTAVLDAHVPPGADKTYLLRKLREVSMWANAAIIRTPDGTPRGPSHPMAETAP